ncbi:S8 family serine peptidase [Nocardia sp. NRRL S-836]|uniref:S8 family serine peptidase n=1 Tax=Nocardia sp. NRRL S-836 TaxID=1519492 RepID=UPI0006AE325C|nr:S8 family serine peptidase [Nocardia sp. NRRL S-836]
MFSRQIIGAGAVAVTLTALAVPQAQAQDVKIAGADSKTAVADSYIVELKDGFTATNAVAGKVGAQVKYRYTKAFNGFAAKMTAEAAKKLATDPAVKSIAQDQVFAKTGEAQSPTPSWGLDRIDQRVVTPDNLYRLRADTSQVHAYVIDTGIKVDHPDFGGRAVWNYNSIDSTNTDCAGHGTHVAGTIGGKTVGVAKRINLHAVKVLDCEGSGTAASVIAGVDWVTANAVKPAVANMSLAGPAFDLLDTAVRNSIASGVSYSVASANFNADACNYSPARVPEALTVNATTSTDTRASFSNWGTCTDIFAPGENIVSTFIDDGFISASGTSMAAPHVAGVSAIYLAVNPTATPAQVQKAMKDSATNDVVQDVAGSPNKLIYVHGASDPNKLRRSDWLGTGQRIVSADGKHYLVMQPDGNLVLYSNGVPKFWTNTTGTTANRAVLQSDGNFVLYDAANRPRWASNTERTTGQRIVVENTGQAVLYDEQGTKLWVSHQV